MSSHIRSIIVDQCLEILKREDVKEENTGDASF